MQNKLLSLLLIFSWVVFAGCSDDATETPDRQLDSPRKIIYFCTTQNESGESQYLSPSECDSDDTTKYAVVLACSKGELALVNLSSEKFIDLDIYQPGYNFIPVGKEAVDMILDEESGIIRILLSSPGRVVSVPLNSFISVIDGKSFSEMPVSKNLTTSQGKLRANAEEFIFLDDPSIMMVSLPKCGAVAAVSGDATVLGAFRAIDATSLGENIENLSCPGEGIPIDGEAEISDEVFDFRPTAIAYDNGKLYSAFSDGETSSLFEITLSTEGLIESWQQIPMEGGSGSIIRIKISPETRWGKFLYAVMQHGDIRVIRLSDNVECDTNVDTRELGDLTIDDPLRGCVPNGTYSRVFTHKTPGIVPGRNQMGVDVAFFTNDASLTSSDLTLKSTLNGTFAFVTTLSGYIYVVNVDETFDDSLYDYRYKDSSENNYAVEVLAHRLRNYSAINASYTTTGRPRYGTDTVYRVEGTIVLPDNLPKLETSDGVYMDSIEQYMSRNESFQMIYQGVIPDSERTSGMISPESENHPFIFRDYGTNFCEKNIVPGDVITFTGCFSNDDCMEGYKCGRSPLQGYDTSGLCFPENNVDDLSNVCNRLLASDREYLISEVYSDTLLLDFNPLYTSFDADSPLECELNSDCYNVGTSSAGVCGEEGFCVSAPSPEVASEFVWCLKGLQNYEIRSGRSFFLYPESSPYIYSSSTETDGSCNYDEDVFKYRITPLAGDIETPFFTLHMNIPDGISIPWRYEIDFSMSGGFSYFVGDLGARLISTINQGPDGYFYITDMGDTGNSATLIGQLIRFVPSKFSVDGDFQIR
ncbi:MAG: hypothetical protein JXR95_11945 [Deltaproteobacteria bacterium]|nr:hypothetical protein [Deltaproteobacteria bacterium]